MNIPVVIRYFSDQKGREWGICHARSYQSAFRREVNGFATRQAAVDFAEANRCAVEFHEHDQCQRAN